MVSAVKEALQQSLLLRNAEEEVIQALLSSARKYAMKGRWHRLEGEDLKRKVHYVVGGEMRMYKQAPDGQDLLVRRLFPGDFFCFSSLMTEHYCESSFVGTSKSSLLYWHYSDFQSVALSQKKIIDNFFKLMAMEVEEERHMRTLARCCRVELLTVGYLIYRLKRDNLCRGVVDFRPISLTAQELGVARETLSRCLTKLSRNYDLPYYKGCVSIAEMEHLYRLMDEFSQQDCDCPCLQIKNSASVCL